MAKKICDFKDNNLHLVGYSVSFNGELSRNELSKRLHYRENYQNVITYVTSYYSKTWGFCISYKEYQKLKPGMYKVVVDTEFVDRSLSLGELVIPSLVKKEIMFSTYICHPSIANNEISGIL